MSRVDDTYINIIGAGLAGLSAAITLAKKGCHVRLFSVQPSERAQSNLAEGGINGALDVMGENDSVEEHFNDTMKGGCYLASPKMVKNLTEAAPEIIMDMEKLGVPFHREEGHIIQRNFGGQKKKRTAYAKSSTGKMLTVALISEARKYEALGHIDRYSHHRFEKLVLNKENNTCLGVQIIDTYTHIHSLYFGNTIIAAGGLNGFFRGLTTGTTANTGTLQAVLFSQGVEMANLEFIQYHPTTVRITEKRMLISEAARGEGGRLFCLADDGSRSYFMEEKYGDRGNLMPRDVISKEMAMLKGPAYLDLTNLSNDTWKNKLSDMREEIIHYLALDPMEDAIPVSPGIHYFMGGILVDENQCTNIKGLYAAGECACAYHGANRLGGNSLLGAIFGGRKSAQAIIDSKETFDVSGAEDDYAEGHIDFVCAREDEKDIEAKMQLVLQESLGIIRDENSLSEAIDDINELISDELSEEMMVRLQFSKAMLICALERRESRGAQVRLDYPETSEEYKKTTVAGCQNKNIIITFRELDD